MAEGGDHNHALTGLRGVAALWVMACHAWYFLGMPEFAWGGLDFTRLFSMGWVGVLVFFVLSGYLLAPPFLRWRRGAAARPDLCIYLLRRVLRVFPAYWVQLLLLVVIAWWSTGTAPLQSLGAWLAHLGMYFNIGADPVLPLNGVWWTLPVEFGFYLVLPVLMWTVPRRGPWLLLLGALVVSLSYHWLGWLWLGDQPINDRSRFVSQLPGFLAVFVYGVVAAWLQPTLDARIGARPLPANLLALSGLGLLLLLMYLVPLENGGAGFWDSATFYFLWRPAAAFAVVLLVLGCALQGSPLNRLLASRVAVFFGDISYSLYLWHLPVILWLATPSMQTRLGVPGQWLAAALLTVLIAWMSAKYIEQPCIGLGKMLIARQQA